MNSCEHVCINTEGSYRCGCHPGYTPLNHTHCHDVDECLADASSPVCGADKTCLNVPGSYVCVCKSGYRTNGTLCIGRSIERIVSSEFLLVYLAVKSLNGIIVLFILFNIKAWSLKDSVFGIPFETVCYYRCWWRKLLTCLFLRTSRLGIANFSLTESCLVFLTFANTFPNWSRSESTSHYFAQNVLQNLIC